MKYFWKFASILAIIALLFAVAESEARSNPRSPASTAVNSPAESHLAQTPPMGWNSYDGYGGDVDEQEVKANADYMAEHLAPFGWKYVVVDYYWYYPEGKVNGTQAMDSYGRLLPDPKRFPSSASGQGFKPLADYVHSRGLKFGIHIMRGIPRAAVEQNLPVFGTNAHARDIVNFLNTCSWSKAMYGVDVTKPAGRAYYNSIAELYARWGVDYIKADDMSRAENPYGEIYHAPEIEALRQAMTRTGRPMILSLSPGPTPLRDAAHVERYSQLWRISNDMWDNWQQVADQFGYCRLWAPYIGPNHWPDPDMLPLGRLRIRGFDDHERMTRLTHDEQRTLMTLWLIFRAPLMIGADLPSLDPFTLSLFDNPEVLAVDQHSNGNHQLFARGKEIAWTANIPGSSGKYLALFNLDDAEPAQVAVRWSELALYGKCAVRDLWQRKDVGSYERQFSAEIPPHGAALYRIAPGK